MENLFGVEGNALSCPKCGSHDVHVKSGMFTDLYTCNKCGCEWRP